MSPDVLGLAMGGAAQRYIVVIQMPDLRFQRRSLRRCRHVVVDPRAPTVKKGVDDPENQRFIRMLEKHRNIWSR
jgi:hypothetical protein